MAGNLTFRGIVFCNVGTLKTVTSNFVTTRQIETPYSSPCKYDHPNNVPVGQKIQRTKNPEDKISRGQQCIISFLGHKLSHDRWLWFLGGGAYYGSLPTQRCDLMVPADWVLTRKDFHLGKVPRVARLKQEMGGEAPQFPQPQYPMYPQ